MGVLVASVAVGFFITSTVIARSHPTSGAGGVDNAMEQARRLMTELQARDFDPQSVGMELLRLPEQDFVSIKSRRAPESRSFVIPVRNSEYDEVAFICDTFVLWNTRYVRGAEAVSLTTGFYIVGWKNGAINTYDVRDVRLYQLPDRTSMIPVFPGMDEYSTELRPYPGAVVPQEEVLRP
jgi:hypothetical protein